MSLIATLGSMARTSLGAPLILIIILMMLVIPLPPFALDVFFTFNIAISLVVLMATVYSERPLDFTVFPTVLLVTTLLRLALRTMSMACSTELLPASLPPTRMFSSGSNSNSSALKRLKFLSTNRRIVPTIFFSHSVPTRIGIARNAAVIGALGSKQTYKGQDGNRGES